MANYISICILYLYKNCYIYINMNLLSFIILAWSAFVSSLIYFYVSWLYIYSPDMERKKKVWINKVGWILLWMNIKVKKRVMKKMWKKMKLKKKKCFRVHSFYFLFYFLFPLFEELSEYCVNTYNTCDASHFWKAFPSSLIRTIFTFISYIIWCVWT